MNDNTAMDDTSTSSDRPESLENLSVDSVNTQQVGRVIAEQDRAREALRRKLGIVDVAVDLVREARDE